MVIMTRRYHIDLDEALIRNARTVLLPGDPGRCAAIAGAITSAYGGKAVKLASKREFTSYLACVKGRAVLVTSTGIGGPSASIAIDELAQIGVKNFIRVGTSGAICTGITTGDVVVTTGSMRLEGASRDYAPIEFPAAADFQILSALVEGAGEAGITYHTGITACSDTFYPGEDRDDGFRDYVLRGLKGIREEWRSLGVLNVDMESATVLTLTASMGLRGGVVTGVINRSGSGEITKEDLLLGEENAIKAAVAALALLPEDIL